MSARLGLITQSGFGEAIRKELQHPIARFIGIALVLGAIVIGNAAYEGGNISGASLGFQELLFNFDITIEGVYFSLPSVIIGLIAFSILITGSSKIIERFLIGLVVVMSLVFLTTAIVVQPVLKEIIRGLLVPTVSADQFLTVVALIGTTVVPYNLFLHASIIQKKYTHKEQLNDLRKENITAVILGGVISMSIVITSAATLFGDQNISSAADMAKQLEPVLGSWSAYFLGMGLFAAGITSAITAPLAAAYAANGILGWEGGLKSVKFKAVWMCILLIGVIFSMLSINPVQLIQFAQVANGILLPLIALFLIYLMNKKSLLNDYVNSKLQNSLGMVVVLVTILISLRSLNSVFHFM